MPVCGSPRAGVKRTEAGKAPSDKDIAVRLVRIEGGTGPRSGDAVSRKFQLEYEFRVAFADPIAEHQAIADLAFAMLERDDLGECSDVVRGRIRLTATFVLQRQRDLPRAKPVREAVINLRPQPASPGSSAPRTASRSPGPGCGCMTATG